MYLGIHRIALFWIWTVSADIFGWTYLYLYLYLNRCICICIWIKVEQNICICICIWKIQIFVFVFVFVFDKTYLTPALQANQDQFWWHWFCSGLLWPKFKTNIYLINSLWHGDAIWWHIFSGANLALTGIPITNTLGENRQFYLHNMFILHPFNSAIVPYFQ